MSDLIFFAECFVQHGTDSSSMRTEKCPARTKPHDDGVVRSPVKTHWEIYTAGRWRRLFRGCGHFVTVERQRLPVTIVVLPEYAHAPCLGI